MAGDEVYINASPGETRLALTRDGQLLDLVVSRQSERHQIGNIYLGRIEKVMTGLNAAFVQIGERKSGFLAAPDGQIYDRDREQPKPIGALFKEGDKVLVQATRDEEEDKGAKLTTRMSLAGRNLVLTPDRPAISVSKSIADDDERERLKAVFDGVDMKGVGLIVRTRAEQAVGEDLRREAEELLLAWMDVATSVRTVDAPALLLENADPILKFINEKGGGENENSWRRIVVNDRSLLENIRQYCAGGLPEFSDMLEQWDEDGDVFDNYELAQQIDDILSPLAPLPSGGEIVIEETAALVAIDVNSGGSSRRGDGENWACAINEEAAREIGRQIRLRNLSGQFAIDFLPMKVHENKEKIMTALREALAFDRGASNVFGFTRLGMLEMTRRRQGNSLTRRLLGRNNAVKSVETVALEAIRAALRELEVNPGSRIELAASLLIHEALLGVAGPAWNAALEASGGMLDMAEDRSLADTAYTVTALKK